MAFVKKTWKNRLSEFPGRRKLKNISTNAETVYDVTRAEGELFQAGDAYSAENMNGLEQRIEDALGTQDLSQIGDGTITGAILVLAAMLGGLSFKVCTQAEYNALATKDANTLYVIAG